MKRTILDLTLRQLKLLRALDVLGGTGTTETVAKASRMEEAIAFVWLSALRRDGYVEGDGMNWTLSSGRAVLSVTSAPGVGGALGRLRVLADEMDCQELDELSETLSKAVFL